MKVLLEHLREEYQIRANKVGEKLKSVIIIIDYETKNISSNMLYADQENVKPAESPDIKILPDGRVGTKDAAKYLGLSLKTLAMYRSNGQGPRFVKKGRIFYFIDDLNEWLQKGRVQDNPPRGEKESK